MKKHGEVIGLENEKITVRIYKIRNDEGEPTSVTVSAPKTISCEIGNIVEVEINALLFFLSSTAGYLFPFLTGLISYFITANFTENLLVLQLVFLITLALTFYFATCITKTSFFKNMIICSVKKVIEE